MVQGDAKTLEVAIAGASGNIANSQINLIFNGVAIAPFEVVSQDAKQVTARCTIPSSATDRLNTTRLGREIAYSVEVVLRSGRLLSQDGIIVVMPRLTSEVKLQGAIAATSSVTGAMGGSLQVLAGAIAATSTISGSLNVIPSVLPVMFVGSAY